MIGVVANAIYYVSFARILIESNSEILLDCSDLNNVLWYETQGQLDQYVKWNYSPINEI